MKSIYNSLIKKQGKLSSSSDIHNSLGTSDNAQRNSEFTFNRISICFSHNNWTFLLRDIQYHLSEQKCGSRLVILLKCTWKDFPILKLGSPRFYQKLTSIKIAYLRALCTQDNSQINFLSKKFGESQKLRVLEILNLILI